MSVAGRAKLAEGREAEIFEWDAGTVLKLYRWRGTGAEREAAALAAVEASGGPAPRLIERVDVDGRPGLVIERIAGRDMLAILERSPQRLVGEARRLAETQTAFHQTVVPEGLPDAKAVLRQKIDEATLAPELRAFSLAGVDSLPDGDRLLHGDFHPGNILLTPAGARVIDWSGAARGHPLIDVARTKLLLDLGEPLAPSGWLRAIIRVGRRAFSRLYLGRYARLVPIDVSLLGSAEPVLAAARLSERVPGEEAALTAIVAAARAAREPSADG